MIWIAAESQILGNPKLSVLSEKRSVPSSSLKWKNYKTLAERFYSYSAKLLKKCSHFLDPGCIIVCDDCSRDLKIESVAIAIDFFDG